MPRGFLMKALAGFFLMLFASALTSTRLWWRFRHVRRTAKIWRDLRKVEEVL